MQTISSTEGTDSSCLQWNLPIIPSPKLPLFTLIFECVLVLAFHKERETAQTWTGIVNMLYRVAGRPLFMQLLPCVLEDNGAPFSDPVMTENARAENNPYKLIPRTKVFYCDPLCATQKPRIERVHEELRRILIKGTNFDLIDQDEVCLALSHVNSNSRASLGNSTPYAEFVKEYGCEGRRFLERLGIARIPANEVTLDPYLLGKKFRRQPQAASSRCAHHLSRHAIAPDELGILQYGDQDSPHHAPRHEAAEQPGVGHVPV